MAELKITNIHAEVKFIKIISRTWNKNRLANKTKRWINDKLDMIYRVLKFMFEKI